MEEADGCRNGVHGCYGCLGELDRGASLCLECLEALPVTAFNDNLEAADADDVAARIAAAEAMGWEIIEEELPRGATTDYSAELKTFLLTEADAAAADLTTRFGLGAVPVEQHPRGTDKELAQSRTKGRLFANVYELAVFGAVCSYGLAVSSPVEALMLCGATACWLGLLSLSQTLCCR